LILATDGSYYEVTAACNGADPLVVTNAYCISSVANLRVSPLLLARNAQVVVKVRAYNVRGWGAFSVVSASTVASIKTEPDQMT
jgi:hypothetical protein